MRRCLECEFTFEGDTWQCPACGREPGRHGGFLQFAPSLARSDGRDADYAHDALVEAEGRHFWFKSRARLVRWVLHRYLPRTTKLLEVGCGTGFILAEIRVSFPAMRLTATDALLTSLALASRRLPGVCFYQADACRIPFREEFDVVAAFDVLEHLDDDTGALREMAQAIRAGGSLLLTVPQHPWLWGEVDSWSRHRRRYTRRGLVATLNRAGLELAFATSFSTLTLPLLLVNRRRKVRQFDPLSELRIGDGANTALGWISAVERGLIHGGMTFPWGGSLLAVARRA